MVVRTNTRQIMLGQVPVGGGAPVTVQSMTNTDTRDVQATVAQIHRLEQAGCQIVRVAVPDEAAAGSIGAIRRQISVPLVADVHFDYRLAVSAIEAGADGLRINPGNIGSAARVRAVVDAARERSVPIRVGVNAGSLEKDLLEKHGGPTAEALVESAMGQISRIEEWGYDRLKVSIKSARVPVTLAANRLLAATCDYPVHLGITEAGIGEKAIIKSVLGIGILLEEGIGDTFRISLTGDPVKEVDVARDVLQFLGQIEAGPELISCPTCGRTEIGLERLALDVQQLLKDVRHPIRVAVMGCVVNGPGEAREADLGIAGGRGEGLLFKKGIVLRKVPEERLLEEFKKELQIIIRERDQED